MSFDRVWIRSNQHPGGWLESSQAEKLNISSDFGMACERLFTQGHYVVLEAGKNFTFDQLFLFETGIDAQDFFDRGFMKWESFIGEDEEGCGCPAFNADDDIEFSVETAADELS
jgi:hypothetical protein